MNLDAIDGKHARRTKNSSPLGELFDHACDNVGVVFMSDMICIILGIENIQMRWYIVQAAQLGFLASHIDAFKNRVVEFGTFTGPGEVLFLYMGIILGHAFIGFDWLTNFINTDVALLIFSGIYYLIFVVMLVKCLSLSHYPTKMGLLISLTARFIPSLMIYFGMRSMELNQFSVICHGLVMAVLTGDMIVAKMASRELHPLIPILIMLSLFADFFCIIVCLCYYLIVLTEIAFHLRIPIFGVKQTVYCNGVYDLTHMGHMDLFSFAAGHGTKLLVGVHNDEAVESYKRKPTMSHSERCETVRKCKYVDQVVPNAPLVIDEEFIREHDIDLVICSEEYDSPDDEYYAAPRKMGILVVKPRKDGISTSELRGRLIPSNK